MGFQLSWIAVRGKDRQTTLDELRLEPTGERTEFPEDSFTAAEVPGWFVVVFARELVEDDIPERLSEDCEAVLAGVEEQVMMSYASGWRNGEQIWSIAHDAQQGIDHLDTGGSLPAGFDEVRARAFAEHKDATDVDYVFEVPGRTARFVTGFAHDDDVGCDFEVLRPAAHPAARPRQRPLFRRR